MDHSEEIFKRRSKKSVISREIDGVMAGMPGSLILRKKAKVLLSECVKIIKKNRYQIQPAGLPNLTFSLLQIV